MHTHRLFGARRALTLCKMLWLNRLLALNRWYTRQGLDKIIWVGFTNHFLLVVVVWVRPTVQDILRIIQNHSRDTFTHSRRKFDKIFQARFVYHFLLAVLAYARSTLQGILRIIQSHSRDSVTYSWRRFDERVQTDFTNHFLLAVVLYARSTFQHIVKIIQSQGEDLVREFKVGLQITSSLWLWYVLDLLFWTSWRSEAAWSSAERTDHPIYPLVQQTEWFSTRSLPM